MSETGHPEATFLASITAGVTHEVRNVLAIIRESAGLVDDLVRACGDGGVLDREKVSRATRRIDVQTKRGSEILTNLNRLSHTLDRDVATLDLNEEVEFVGSLAAWAARRAGREVRAVKGTPGLSLSTNPLGFQMALFAAIECGFDLAPKGGGVILRGVDHNGHPSVEVAEASGSPSETLDLDSTDSWKKLSHVLAPLNAVVEPTAAGFRIVFERYS